MHAEVHASQTEPELCGLHVLPRHSPAAIFLAAFPSAFALWVRPLLAGIGDPAQMRERGFGAQPVGVVTGGDEYLAADCGADPGQRDQSRSRRGHQCAQLGVGDVAGWSQPGAGRDQLGVAQCPQLLTQLRRGGDKECLELVGGLAAGFDGTASRYPQQADCLDPADLGLRTPVALRASAARAGE